MTSGELLAVDIAVTVRYSVQGTLGARDLGVSPRTGTSWRAGGPGTQPGPVLLGSQ